MTPLTANLKVFYQRRALWFFYGWLGLTSVPLAMVVIGGPRRGAGWCAGVLIVSLVMGIAAAGLQHEVLIKPFAFMLPGHRGLPRRVLTVVGLAVNLPLGLVALRYPNQTLLAAWAAVAATGSLALAFYALTVVLSLPQRTVNPVIGFLPLIIFGLSLLDVPKAIELAVFGYPGWVVLGSLAAVALAWQALGGEDLARRLSGARSLSLFESFDLRKAQEYRRQAIAERLQKAGDEDGPSRRERFFLARLLAGRPGGSGRAAWGVLYERFGVYPVRLMLQMLAPMAFLLLFGYGHMVQRSGSLADIAFVAGGMVTLHLVLPTSFTLPLPLGRRQRFVGTLAGVASLTLVALVVLALACVASHLLAQRLPPLTFKGMTWPYRAMSPGGLVVTLLLAPLGSLCRSYLRDPFLRLLPMLAIMMSYWFWFSTFLTLPGPIQALAVAASWVCTVALLAWHCFRRDLTLG